MKLRVDPSFRRPSSGGVGFSSKFSASFVIGINWGGSLLQLPKLKTHVIL